MAAVLVAIAIPVFTTQLEKSRETTDIANLRSAYGAATLYSMANSATGDMFYDTTADGALASNSGTKIGQGTPTDGKADLTGLPGGCSYSNNTDAKGKQIKVTFNSGSVSLIQFT